ncbi:MAG: type I restriction enzyme HsdR N-terminal domain-containing protein [Hornefia butyriciproducens]|uniref:type I restriction endonuclease n=1 Tax=Hornefia butyriciproducens TaxID=2652293 RepID=UPI002A753A56|nr:type I restriction endonuclease [Hornefia butyriciproducens]MDY2991607.1 type I restriction enzyme HsdR N-terminal domain-containing protein [Hornefia butyriciproducens]
MEFQEAIKDFSKKVPSLVENASTEEATKMSLIVPFFKLLGYDVFDPTEFCPEFTADIGIKKKEKVDYAILDNEGNPTILIECKPSSEKLDKHGSQLFRYFSTTTAKFAILTNGVLYRFYTDLDETNRMDLVPFMEIDMLNLRDALIPELKKFAKNNFDQDMIFSTAEDLKYSSLIKDYLKSEMESPTDDFVKEVLLHIYDGPRTQKIIEKFSPLVKKAFTSFVNELVNQKISSALSSSENTSDADPSLVIEKEPTSKIVTTDEELEAFHIVRALLVGTVPVEDVVYRDTESYFGILYKDNNRKPICRIGIGSKRMQIQIPDENKNFTRHYLNSLNDIYSYRDSLTTVVKRYL